MFELLTRRARRALVSATQHAEALGHGSIGPEHLLLGLLADPDSVAGRVLAGYGIEHAEAVRQVRAGVCESVRRAGLDEADVAALADLGIDVEAVVTRAEESFGPGALVPCRPRLTRRGRFGRLRRRRRFRFGRVRHRVPLTLPFRPETTQILGRAPGEARELGHPFLGTEHLLLAVLAVGRGPAYDLLASYGIDHAGARRAVLECLRRAS
jgi:ATP-dependent Clp protease ATP-binding subunit ClpA